MFNQENITKKCNLLISDPISCYMNACSQQNHEAFEVFYDFLNEISPARIVEIGTGFGGFTLALQSFILESGLNTKIKTYDIVQPHYHKYLTDAGVEVHVEDIFTHPQTSVQYTYIRPDVVSFVKEEGITVVICDGKSKTNEFKLFADHLKVGDYMLAHDYYENLETFNDVLKYNVWNWNEICLEEIEEPMKQNNLVQYKKEVFNKVAWVCTVKQ